MPTMTPSTPTRKPSRWSPKHDDFISRHAWNGEDATCIAILVEAEYPDIECPKEWVKRRLDELKKTERP